METILSVRGLSVTFPTAKGPFKAVSEVDLDLKAGERLALMGESGCGKSVLGHAILGLMDSIAKVEGSIVFLGQELRSVADSNIRKLRGGSLALIPQSPTTALDPVIRIGKQIDEMFVRSGLSDKKQRRQLITNKLEDVGFSEIERIYNAFAHQMSGGMCERAVIAMGTALDPLLLIADEPTKGLDPLSKTEFLRLLKKESQDKALIMITHDYHAAKICKNVAIMYAGEIIEHGPQQSVLQNPQHPYTIGLWNSLPENGLQPIPGIPRSGNGIGCSFSHRCLKRQTACLEKQFFKDLGGEHKVRCCFA
jgi:peptide/nickel transport system ATP-binding protein